MVGFTGSSPSHVFLFLCVVYLCAVRNMGLAEHTVCQGGYGKTQMSSSQPCQHCERTSFSQVEHIYCETILKRTVFCTNSSWAHLHRKHVDAQIAALRTAHIPALEQSYSVRSLLFCSVRVVEFSQSFPRLALSYLLGMLDGSIQGAEEGTAFLHDTMEMHLMEKVALCIAEILGTKPGQSRQAGILWKAPEEKRCWNRHIFLVFQLYYHSVF